MSNRWDEFLNTNKKNSFEVKDGKSYKFEIKTVDVKTAKSGKPYMRISAVIDGTKGPWFSVMAMEGQDPKDNRWINKLGKLKEVLGATVDPRIVDKITTLQDDQVLEYLDLSTNFIKPGLTFYATAIKGKPHDGKDQWTWNEWSVSKFEIQQPTGNDVMTAPALPGTETTEADLDDWA